MVQFVLGGRTGLLGGRPPRRRKRILGSKKCAEMKLSTELFPSVTYSASRSLHGVFLLGVSVCRKAARVSKTEPIFSTPPPLSPPPTLDCCKFCNST